MSQKIISWNVNGLRAVLKKDFCDFLKEAKADIICIQETKLQRDQVPAEFEEFLAQHKYNSHWVQAIKKGYSGVATFSRSTVLSQGVGIGDERFDREGRTLMTEYKDFYLVNCYFPNSQPGLLRLDYKKAYNTALLSYINQLKQKKNVIVCGDFNVAHEAIDLKNPKANENNPGFYIDERNWFSHLLNSGFIDTFRIRHVDEAGHYSWWSYRFNARAKNIGWRIDYFVVNEAFDSQVINSVILKDIEGSDHCPIQIEIK